MIEVSDLQELLFPIVGFLRQLLLVHLACFTDTPRPVECRHIVSFLRQLLLVQLASQILLDRLNVGISFLHQEPCENQQTKVN